MAECLPCGMFFSMQKGFTDVCEAFFAWYKTIKRNLIFFI